MVSTKYTGLYQIKCVYKILMHWHKTINTGSIEEKKRKEKKRKEKKRNTSDKEMMPTHSPHNALCMTISWYNLEITITIQLR
jgi:hypothetical protein